MALNKKGQDLEKRFSAVLDGDFPFLPYEHFNAFEKGEYPVIDAEKKILPAKWGLIPAWVKDQERAEKMHKSNKNARVETLSEKISFKDAYSVGRVLVPVTAFFEWQGAKGQKNMVQIKYGQNELFSLAGLAVFFPLWHCYTFTVVTRPSIVALEAVHHRMPVVLSKETEHQWLEQGGTLESLQTPEGKWDLQAKKNTNNLQLSLFNEEF